MCVSHTKGSIVPMRIIISLSCLVVTTLANNCRPKTCTSRSRLYGSYDQCGRSLNGTCRELEGRTFCDCEDGISKRTMFFVTCVPAQHEIASTTVIPETESTAQTTEAPTTLDATTSGRDTTPIMVGSKPFVFYTCIF